MNFSIKRPDDVHVIGNLASNLEFTIQLQDFIGLKHHSVSRPGIQSQWWYNVLLKITRVLQKKENQSYICFCGEIN